MKQIILTDIHGCYEEMRRLLDAANFRPEDKILGVSDSVDKGPDSAQVVKFFRSLGNQVVHVRGNHEMKFLRFVKAYRKDSAKAMERRGSKDMEKTLSGLDDQDIDWLNNGATWAQVEGQNAIVVHAGIEPALKHLPQQYPQDKKQLDSCSALWYTRYVKNGRMVKLGQEDPDCDFWSDVYDGRFGHVYYGHQPFFLDAPRESTFATGLDLAGVMGGRLAAAVIEDKQTRTVSVRCKAYVDSAEIYPNKDE